MIIKKFKYILKNLVLLTGSISLLVFILFYLYFPIKTNHGDTISVPNLIGMDLDDVSSLLEDRDLRFEILEDSSYNSEYPPLTVLQQNPSERNKVKENRKIYLTLNSTIPPQIKMPNIINGSVKNAQLILESYDLKIGEIKYVSDMAFNAVLKMYSNGDSISSGQLIDKGSKIDLEVGNGFGNQVFESPNLIGMDLDEAKFTIIGSGLKLGRIIYQDSGFVYLNNLNEEEIITTKIKIDPGKIFRQFPESLSEVKIGQKVNLWVVKNISNEDN